MGDVFPTMAIPQQGKTPTYLNKKMSNWSATGAFPETRASPA
jgi:hypothetical protein